MSDEANQTPDPLTEQALTSIREVHADAVVEAQTTGRHPWIRVTADALRDVCRLLKADADLAMDCCHLVSGTDYPKDDEIEVLYHLCSYTAKPTDAYRKRAEKNDPILCIKVRVPRATPDVPTVMDIWIGADWHERETFDLVGVNFTGRKELQRILLPEDWPGHPLRKDWQYPAEYHGIPIIPPEGM